MRPGVAVLTLMTVAVAGCGSTAGPLSQPSNSATSKSAASKPRADTGRMSTGEHANLVRVTGRYNDEVADFGEQLRTKCGAIASAGQLAEFSDCAKDAYDGVEDKYAAADVVFDDLIKATAKTCRRRMKLLERRLRQVQGTVEATAESARNLQLTGVEAATAKRYLDQRVPRFLSAYGRAANACKPA